MTVQLLLLDDNPSEWRIPEGTKVLGRKGIAEARAALHRIPRRSDASGPDTGPNGTTGSNGTTGPNGTTVAPGPRQIAA